jgi:hypothetical protein
MGVATISYSATNAPTGFTDINAMGSAARGTPEPPAGCPATTVVSSPQFLASPLASWNGLDDITVPGGGNADSLSQCAAGTATPKTCDYQPYSAANAFNDIEGTQPAPLSYNLWEPPQGFTASDPAYLGYDFGADTTSSFADGKTALLSGFSMSLHKWHDNFPKEFSIQASHDGTAFTCLGAYALSNFETEINAGEALVLQLPASTTYYRCVCYQLIVFQNLL